MSLQTSLMANAVLDLLLLVALAAVFRPAFSGGARKSRPAIAREHEAAATFARADDLAA